MPSPRFPIPQGTLDPLILQVLSLVPAHGCRMEQVNQGPLYSTLHLLQEQAWLRAEWKQSETRWETDFYSITPAGRRQLAVEGAVNLIFKEGSR